MLSEGDPNSGGLLWNVMAQGLTACHPRTSNIGGARTLPSRDAVAEQSCPQDLSPCLWTSSRSFVQWLPGRSSVTRGRGKGSGAVRQSPLSLSSLAPLWHHDSSNPQEMLRLESGRVFKNIPLFQRKNNHPVP